MGKLIYFIFGFRFLFELTLTKRQEIVKDGQTYTRVKPIDYRQKRMKHLKYPIQMFKGCIFLLGTYTIYYFSLSNERRESGLSAQSGVSE